MRIPAIRAKIGDWTYYVTTLSFEQVSQFVSRVDDELHKSEGLNELIQRSITNNYLSIKDYILNQPEMFFNALVLAVYDDYPDWREIEFKYEGEETYQMGILEFPGNHKIFPVDGQHRVEGIKESLKEMPELADQRIAAIFIGHKNDSAGMRRTRRLFSTLNRYAKPVTMDDIIALDEDDSIAIVTRELLESFDLFTLNRVTNKSKNKNIPESDKNSITSIITLYQCNRELLKQFRRQLAQVDPKNERNKLGMEEYLKFRPAEKEILSYFEFTQSFWSAFLKNLNDVKAYLEEKSETPALKYRNRENGGNLIFRPVGLLPLIQAGIEVARRSGRDYDYVFSVFNKIDFTISQRPWKHVLWNPNEKTMIMGSGGTVKLLLFYMYGQNLIRASELTSLKHKYADKIGIEFSDSILNDIPVIEH